MKRILYIFLLTLLFPYLKAEDSIPALTDSIVLSVDSDTDALDSIEIRLFEWYFASLDTTPCTTILDTTALPDSTYKNRLQALPCIIELPYNPIAKRYIQRYIRHSPRHTARIMRDAEHFFPIFEEALYRHDLPFELRYVPVIESALRPTARSRAGAAGLWQFMPSTAKKYGLEVNSLVDERMDVYKSTEAACRFLREAYSKYGDWMTVAASYNGGQAGMDRRIQSQNQEHALDQWLVDETSRYMFRILAAKMMFENPRQFGFRFTAADLYPYIPPKRQVTVTDPIDDLVAFAEKNGVTFADLKRANLWLRESKLNNASHRTYIIDIPDTEALRYDPSGTKVHSPAWVR